MIDMCDILSAVIAKDCVKLSVDLEESYKSGLLKIEDIIKICNMTAEETIKRIKEETKS